MKSSEENEPTLSERLRARKSQGRQDTNFGFENEYLGSFEPESTQSFDLEFGSIEDALYSPASVVTIAFVGQRDGGTILRITDATLSSKRYYTPATHVELFFAPDVRLISKNEREHSSESRF